MNQKQPDRQAIPVSVKTRLGFDSNIIDTWLPELLATHPAVITLHGRTLKQAYTGQADWQAIAQAVKIRDEFFASQKLLKNQLCKIVQHSTANYRSKTLIFGNGDVSCYSEALEKMKQTKVDGVLIGRASFGKPWVFNKQPAIVQLTQSKIALEHAKLYEQTYQKLNKKFPKIFAYSFLPMRKHLAWYIKGVPGAVSIRSQLVQTDNYNQVKEILNP